MNRRTHLTILTMLTVCLAVGLATAQTRNRTRGRTKTPPLTQPASRAAATPLPTPTPDPRTAVPQKRTFNHNAKFETNYDKFIDLTTLRFFSIISEPSEPRYRPIGPTFSLFAGFDYPGQILKAPPEKIFLGFQFFIYEGRGRKYADVFAYDNNFILLADDLRLKGTMPRKELTDGAGGKYEVVINLFDYADFMRIANSKSVEVRVGTQEFKLTESHLEALRDLASRTVP